MGGGGEEEEETRGLVTNEEKMEKTGERGGEKRKGGAPQGSSVTSEKRVQKKHVEADPSAWEKSPSACGKKGKEEGWRREEWEECHHRSG